MPKPIQDDDIQQALAGLRRGWDALSSLRRRLPVDSLVGAQAAHVQRAINGIAETLTDNRNYFRD